MCLSLSGQHHAVSSCQEQTAGVQDEDSESAQKLAEIERLRQAEKFMVVGTGEATCMGCGYEYSPKNGDPEYPITPGTYFTVRPASGAYSMQAVCPEFTKNECNSLIRLQRSRALFTDG